MVSRHLRMLPWQRRLHQVCWLLPRRQLLRLLTLQELLLPGQFGHPH